MSSLFIPWRRTRELLTPAEMARADAAAIAAGAPGIELMRRAGEAVAEIAARLALPASRAAPRIHVLCGPGNNGGDGYVAARVLRDRGFRPSIFALAPAIELRGDALLADQAWGEAPTPLADWRPEACDLVIDALFGAGLSRDLDGLARDAVQRLNQWRGRGGRVLAVDVPSGLDGATGAIRGAAVEADATITFFRPKPGHFLLPGRDLCGELHLAHIGIADHAALQQGSAGCFLNSPALWQNIFPALTATSHKYTRGHAVVVSGPAFHTGAARLSARAALRVGAGLTTVAGAREALAQHAAQLTEIMLAPTAASGDLLRLLDDPRKNAVVIGPGLGLDASAEADL